MDISGYLESGILEEYCLGLLSSDEESALIENTLLYPEIKLELTRVELFMEQFAQANALEICNDALRERILNSLDITGLDLNNLPLIDHHTDYKLWINALKHLIPTQLDEDMVCEMLRHDDRVTQTLIASKIDVPEEIHGNVLESFLILQGECECSIGDLIFRAGPGNLIQIPLNTEHDVRIISPFVVAVLQHQLI